MPKLVLLAKSTYVWLDQMSKRYRQDIRHLDEIPDVELDELAARGFTGLWLIGPWRRSEASRRIKHLRGQPDAIASAYALDDYVLAEALGGLTAYENLRDRAWNRGIWLASDMVPNHVGIDGRWVIEHPDWFIQLSASPYPSYTFDGPDLSSDASVSVFIENHYYDSSDAAVVFKRVDRATGEARYLYHGNDGTSMPWNDTAQIDYLNPEAREAVIQTILQVAGQFPIIRFDAAMTLAKRHVQRLWFPESEAGGAIPSRAQYGSLSEEAFDRRMPHEFWREVVDRVADERPDTLLLAEAFWQMEGYFVRTLGMHRVYNSAFMTMMRDERNTEYRQLMKNVLEFESGILGRFVNFMNNPDEETAVAQFGKDDKYFGVAVVMSTMPGLPMFGHGQIEGYSEKYGMEFRAAKREELPDPWLVERHRREIVPLLHRREQFAGVDGFLLFDLTTSEGTVNEDVFAYSNRFEDESSLVVYHNRSATARGWLTESAAFPVERRDTAPRIRRDLHEGLDIVGGPGMFVVMREAITGLEHLYLADRLVHNGFYLELGAFEYRVYLDIREVGDEVGDLARLEEDLAGRGVVSVERARQELRLRPLHDAVVAALAPTASATEAARRLSEVASELARMRAEAVLKTSGETEGRRGAPAIYAPEAGSPAPQPRAAALLRRLGITSDPYRELKLEPRLEREWFDYPDAKGAAQMVPVLLDLEVPPQADLTASETLNLLVDGGPLRNLLEVHEYGGVRWFSKGRFALLAAAMVPWLTGDVDPKRSAQLTEALERLAEESGYRYDVLLASSAPQVRPADPEGPSPG